MQDDNGEDSDDSSSDSGELAPKAPPSSAEMSLLIFLADNEGDIEVRNALDGLLSNPKVSPPILEKISCQFVKDYIAAFLSPANMPLAAFGESLPVRERAFFDYALSCVPSAIDCGEKIVVETILDKKKVLTSLLRAIYRQPIFEQRESPAR
jgi:hypothetical protein